jgi:uncharacterized protein (DUF1330 family)
MPAFWLARAKIIEPEGYNAYREATKKLTSKFPRKVLARGGRYQVLEGQTSYDRFVILEYPSFEDALTYFHSPEYQTAAALRREGAGINEVVIVDGVDPSSHET